MPPVYLDYNATTPPDPRVVTAVVRAMTAGPANPASRDHRFGWDAADAVEAAREAVAELVGVTPPEVVFTSGATEGINLALKGRAMWSGVGPRAVVTFATEHQAVLAVGRQLDQLRVPFTVLPVDQTGRPDLSALRDRLRAGDVDLVAVMLANNETGVTHPVRAVADLAHAAGAVVFSDITQAVGKVPVDLPQLGVDLATFSAHKMYGPMGVGAIVVRAATDTIDLEPVIAGGGQERGLRGGTVNTVGVIGFGEACRIAAAETAPAVARLTAFRDRFEAAVLAGVPGARVNGAGVDRLPNTSSITFPDLDARAMLHRTPGVAASTRSACSTGQPGPSHVLTAMGLSDDDAFATARFSLGRFTSADDVTTAIGAVIAGCQASSATHHELGRL
jgi:cysteine desulfurase